MAERYRVADFSLQHRIDTHEFGKAYASALFAPARFALSLMEYSLAWWGVASEKPKETAVVVPFSEFGSFYARRAEEEVGRSRE